MAEPAQAMFADDVASQSLGMELAEAGEGTAVVRMRITDQMVNGHAIAHGGYLFMLADTAFACACNSYGPPVVAAGAEISFVASARLGDELVATAAERVLSDPVLRAVLIDRGRERAREFTLEAARQGFSDAIEQLLATVS